MDFLLGELHGLIKWNPWQKTTCYFSLYFTISVKRESAINFGGKKRRDSLGHFEWLVYVNTIEKQGWEQPALGMIYFSCSEARALLLLHPGFWNCVKFIWVKKGTKKELLENRVTSFHVQTHYSFAMMKRSLYNSTEALLPMLFYHCTVGVWSCLCWIRTRICTWIAQTGWIS